MNRKTKNYDEDFELEEEIRNRNKAYSKWLPEENAKYAKYLEENEGEFEITKSRRTLNFFIKMAEELGLGKNNLQCRSHHQKMLKKYGSVEGIIKAFQNSSTH